MHQPLFGAIIPFLCALVWYLSRHQHASWRFLLLTPAAMFLGALWAVVPDMPKLLGQMDLYYQLQASPWSNLFFLHRYIDRIETQHLDALAPLFLLVLIAMILSLLLAAWRELYRIEYEQSVPPQHEKQT